MEPVCKGVILFLALTTATLQHGSVQKPLSEKGCYHGEEGTFYWSLAGDNLALNISAHIGEGEWVGIGFSTDNTMGNDDVVAVYSNSSSTQSFVPAALLNPNGQSTTVFQKVDSLVNTSVSYVEGVVHANITKSINLSSPISNLHTTPVFIFFAKGKINVDNPGTPLHKHYKIPTISRNPVNLSSNMPACITTKTNNLLKLHGVIMVLVWLNLTPLAVYIARYTKFYFKRQGLWFTIHKYSGLTSGVLVVVAVCVAYAALGDLVLEQHQVVGLSVLLVLGLHILLALMRPDHSTRYRALWELVHKSTAALLTLACLTNIVNGLYMLKVHDVCYWVISAQITLFCLLFLLLENPQQAGMCFSRVCLCLRLSPRFYHSLNSTYKEEDSETDGQDITMLNMDLDTPTTRLNLVRLGLWTIVLVNTIVTVTVVTALAYT